MPNPISGTAVALAATQLRIINLDQVLDTNISTSMNFAIDFANQTFRMTGLQLTDYLNQSLAITAGNVGFDNAIFQSVFPLEPSPPTNAQDVIDYGLPILANADAGNMGKSTGAVIDADTVSHNAVFVDSVSGRSILSVASADPSAGWQFISDFGIEPTPTMRALNSGTWRPEVNFFVSSTRTSAQANASLDLADTAMQQTDLDAYLPLTGGALTGGLDMPKGIYLTFGGDPVLANDIITNESILRGGNAIPDGNVAISFRNGANASVVRVYDDGSTSGIGDITAFFGTTVLTQPFIAATGATTAYDLIELLLDKVDELETRLANAGIA